jgi:hypothetical protein
MAGLTHLKDLFNTKGYKFIENLFSKNVYITEKIDGARFAVERNGDEVSFYKRDGGKPINLVDRTVMKYYEPAIEYIESLKPSSIPEGIRFGFEYFANNNPGSIVYSKVPKNGLIMTDVSKGGSFNTNIDDLTKYAKLFKVTPPPVIFDGKLSAEQKNQLTDFLTTEWDDLYLKFKTESFTAYIISILNPKLKNTALHIGTTEPIEGIVFSFNDGGDFVNAKVVDPLYTQKARNMAKAKFTPDKKESEQKSKEILKHIITFVKSKADLNVKLTNDTKDKRYIELLGNVFKQFHAKNKGKFKSFSADDKSKEIAMLDVNYKFISDKELITILKSDSKIKNVFKIFLATFGKTRKSGSVTLDKSMVSDVNSLIGKLQRLSENSAESQLDYILSEIVNKTKIS